MSAVTKDNLPAPAPVVRFQMELPAQQDRGVALQLRVSVPQMTGELPVILFSHGNGSSREGYGPLVDFWAAHGYAVVQPTHLDSRTLALAQDDPRRAAIWRFRAQDITSALDHWNSIEELIAPLGASLDRERIAAVGHSWGGQTIGMLLGARLPEPETGATVDLLDERIKAGILLAAPGRGGTDLKAETAKRFPFLHPSFAEMTTPALIVYGDRDYSHMTPRGPDWRANPYFLSPAPEMSAHIQRRRTLAWRHCRLPRGGDNGQGPGAGLGATAANVGIPANSAVRGHCVVSVGHSVDD